MATRLAHGQLVLRLLYVLHICFFVRVSALITCTIIVLCTLLQCNFTLVNLTAALCTGVATVYCESSRTVTSSRYPGAEQCRCNNMRLTESKNTRSEQLLLMPTEQLAENGCQENSWMDWNVRRPGWYFGYEISKWEMERGNWGGRERHWSTRIVDEEIATSGP